MHNRCLLRSLSVLVLLLSTIKELLEVTETQSWTSWKTLTKSERVAHRKVGDTYSRCLSDINAWNLHLTQEFSRDLTWIAATLSRNWHLVLSQSPDGTLGCISWHIAQNCADFISLKVFFFLVHFLSGVPRCQVAVVLLPIRCYINYHKHKKQLPSRIIIPVNKIH